jgi:hypothetical protein
MIESIVKLPKAQVAIIIKALEHHKQELENNVEDDQAIEYEHFDTLTLLELLKYPVTIDIPIVTQLHFATSHGIDFPKYTKD